MQLVIDIPEEIYKASKNMMLITGRGYGKMLTSIISGAIATGTPLPKGHGRLIDADALYEQYVYADYNFDMTMEYAPTIIEAESEDK